MPIVDQGEYQKDYHNCKDNNERPPRTNFAMNLKYSSLTKQVTLKHNDQDIDHTLLNISR